jgi:hypothetical protein
LDRGMYRMLSYKVGNENPVQGMTRRITPPERTIAWSRPEEHGNQNCEYGETEPVG